MELVGECQTCGKCVYCRDGFLDGVTVGEPAVLYCHDCFAKLQKQEEGDAPKDDEGGARR